LPGGSFYSTARGVSADGSVIMGESTSASGIEAFRWQGGTMTGLGFLGGIYSEAKDMSADGSVIVGYGSSVNGDKAFIWQESTGMLSLESVLTAAGVDLTGWSLGVAGAISADGLTVVGRGLNPSGQEELWRATLGATATPTPVPTPALLPGLVGMGLTAYRKRKLASANTLSTNA
jgi:probable HAF family extracellular repeat protein